MYIEMIECVCPVCQAAAGGGSSLRHQSWLPDPGATNTPSPPISGTLLQIRGEKNQREDTESHHREEVLQHLFVTDPEKRYDVIFCVVWAGLAVVRC